MNGFFKFLTVAAVLTSCNSTVNNTAKTDGGYNGKQPKYIFYFIGDGMSQPQITMAEKAINDKDFLAQFNTQTCNIRCR